MSHGSNTQYISAVNARGAGKCWRAVGDPASVGWPWHQTRRNAFQYFDSTFDCFTLLLDLNHHLGQSHCGLWVWGRDQNHKRRGLKKVGMKLTVCVNQMIVLAIDPWNVFQVSYWLFFSSSELLLHPVTWKRQQRTSLTPAELQLSRVSLPTRFFKQFHFLYWNYQNLELMTELCMSISRSQLTTSKHSQTRFSSKTSWHLLKRYVPVFIKKWAGIFDQYEYNIYVAFESQPLDALVRSSKNWIKLVPIPPQFESEDLGTIWWSDLYTHIWHPDMHLRILLLIGLCLASYLDLTWKALSFTHTDWFHL